MVRGKQAKKPTVAERKAAASATTTIAEQKLEADEPASMDVSTESEDLVATEEGAENVADEATEGGDQSEGEGDIEAEDNGEDETEEDVLVALAAAVTSTEEAEDENEEIKKEEDEQDDEDTEKFKKEELGVECDGAVAKKEKTKPPLTEEDVAYIKELVRTKHTLPDGAEVFIFSYGPPTPADTVKKYRPVVCHLCRMKNLSPQLIKYHLEGKRHKDSLKRRVSEERLKEPFNIHYSDVSATQKKSFEIYPGEDIEEVTPEYESRIVDRVEWDFKAIENKEILEQLQKSPIYEYNKTRPLIGLDYVLRYKRKDQVQCFCALCQEKFQDEAAFRHVTHIHHQAAYIIKHFPRLYEKVTQKLKMSDARRKEEYVRDVFRKLYRKIENKHGFKQMIPVDSDDFQMFQSRYVNKVRRDKHYGEDTLDFTEAEVDVLIRKINNNMQFIAPDSVTVLPSSTLSSRKRKAPPAPTSVPAAKIGRQDIITGASKLIGVREMDQWRKYASVKDKDIDKIKLKYKDYKKKAESHPEYKNEWSEFWHARCDELKKANINPDTHDFEKEWLPQWSRRLRKLFLKEVLDHKMVLRKQHGLPQDPLRRTPSPLRSERILKDRIKQDAYSRRKQTEARVKGIVVPLFRDNRSTNLGLDSYPADIGGRRGAGQNQRRGGIPPAPTRAQNPPRRRGPVSVISALRLLTALEDQLGSLGPKSVQLLGRAVLCEKNNQLKELLLDNEYYVLFATAKEKLKGQILANVVDPSKIQAVNTTINDLSEITNVMDKANRNHASLKSQSDRAPRGGAPYGGNNNRANDRSGGRNDNFGGGLQNDDDFYDGRNFQNQRGGNGNFRNDNGDNGGGNFRGDGGNFQNDNLNFPSDNGNFSGGYNNESVNNRNSNYGGGNYNEGSNYRNNNDLDNFNNSNRNLSGLSFAGNLRGAGFNDGGNMNRNYRSDNMGGDFNNTSGGSGYRGGNVSSGNMNSASNFGGNRGSNNSNLGFTSSAGNLGGVYNSDTFSKASGFGNGGGNNYNSSSALKGNWMSGNVYANKPSGVSSLFTSDLTSTRSFDNRSGSNFNNSSNYNSGDGLFQRYN